MPGTYIALIDVTLSELFIWDVPSPYTGPGSGAFLDQFGVTRTSFNGDMAHLISYGGGGGVAWLNTLCNSQTRLRMAFSGINSTYANVPTYSWSTMVVTHEADVAARGKRLVRLKDGMVVYDGAPTREHA